MDVKIADSEDWDFVCPQCGVELKPVAETGTLRNEVYECICPQCQCGFDLSVDVSICFDVL